jgi:2-dehydropantoate 2-reductase
MKVYIYGAGALRGWRGHGLALTACHLRVLQLRATLQAIGARLGIMIDQQPEDHPAVTHQLEAFKPSMLQDVEAGKAVGLDALVRSMKQLGTLTQAPTHCSDALLGLVRLQAQVRGFH